MSTTISIVLMVIASVVAAFGQLNLKLGSTNLKINLSEILKNYMLLAGFFFYGISIIISVIALRGSELTILYPLASLNYIWVSLLSVKYLKERMNKYKWLGIVLIILGVVLIV